jgi:hypothetical protein
MTAEEDLVHDCCASEEILMDRCNQKRRSFLFAAGGLGMSQMLPLGFIEGQAAAERGFVLGANEGEHLIHFRDHGNIFIKLGSATGSENLALAPSK